MTIKIYNDDCLLVLPQIADKSINAIICDLPYGTTNNPWDTVIPLDELWAEYNRIIKDNGAIVLTSSQPFTSTLVMSNLKHFKYEWIWRKSVCSGSMNAKIMPLKQHESVLVFSGNTKRIVYYPIMTAGKPYSTKPEKFAASNYGDQKRPAVVNTGTRYPTSVLDIKNPRMKGGHPTQKPVDLMKHLIQTYTVEGDVVLDNCMGSGATGIACVKTNRHFIGIEKNDEYYNYAKKRIDETDVDEIVIERKQNEVVDSLLDI